MLTTLQNEVKAINDKIIALCEQNPELKALYKGCQIYFSPLVKNPDLMLIGINPGSGYFKNNGKPVQKFEPVDNYNEGGILFEEFKYGIFRKLNKETVFESSFITNAYFFATDTKNDLEVFLKLLPEDFRIEVKQQSVKWLKQIVSNVSPKLILCEGHTAFDYLKRFYGDSMAVINNKGSVLEAKIDNIPIVGCERMGATIIKKELLIEKLKGYFI
jgi:uracil-DNA glycosylase